MRTTWWTLLAACAVLAVGCSGTSGASGGQRGASDTADGGADVPAEPDVSEQSLTVEMDQQACRQIGPDGGTVESVSGDLVLTFSEGAVAEATEVCVGTNANVPATWMLTPHGVVFEAPVEALATIQPPDDTQPHGLLVWAEDGTLEALSFDTASQVEDDFEVAFTVEHFSLFSVYISDRGQHLETMVAPDHVEQPVGATTEVLVSIAPAVDGPFEIRTPGLCSRGSESGWIAADDFGRLTFEPTGWELTSLEVFTGNTVSVNGAERADLGRGQGLIAIVPYDLTCEMPVPSLLYSTYALATAQGTLHLPCTVRGLEEFSAVVSQEPSRFEDLRIPIRDSIGGPEAACTEECGDGILSESEVCEPTDDRLGDECVATLGGTYRCNAECQCENDPVCGDDHIESNEECEPAVGGCPTGQGCADDCTCEPIPECTEDAMCDDGDLCTADSCQNESCVNSAIEGCCLIDAECPTNGDMCSRPVCLDDNTCGFEDIGDCCRSDSDCNDMDECTRDSCDVSTGLCSNEMIDDDGDGFGPGPECGGDCHDGNATVNPGQSNFFDEPYPRDRLPPAWDYNCDGDDEYELPGNIGRCCIGACDEPCTLQFEGWDDPRFIPLCGGSANWLIACDNSSGPCERVVEERTRRCR